MSNVSRRRSPPQFIMIATAFLYNFCYLHFTRDFLFSFFLFGNYRTLILPRPSHRSLSIPVAEANYFLPSFLPLHQRPSLLLLLSLGSPVKSFKVRLYFLSFSPPTFTSFLDREVTLVYVSIRRNICYSLYSIIKLTILG
jgi:hypothetical protein